MTFPCDKCGRCCRAVKCSKLVLNECSIYETRPDVCRVDKFAEIFGMSKEDAYKLNKEYCNKLRERRER